MAATPPFTASIAVAAGGGVGAVLRYQLGRVSYALVGPQLSAAFPWGTLAANLIGSLAMGVLVGWLARHGGGESWRLLLGVGLLGGFTTFSAFSLELVTMTQRGTPGMAAIYAAVSLAGGIGGVVLGLMIMRSAA